MTQPITLTIEEIDALVESGEQISMKEAIRYEAACCPLTDKLKDDDKCVACPGGYDYDGECWYGRASQDEIVSLIQGNYDNAIADDNAHREG